MGLLHRVSPPPTPPQSSWAPPRRSLSISKTLMGECSAQGGTSLVWGSGTPRAGRVSGTCPHVSITHCSFSALHHAALNGNTELITLLLEAQAAVDIKDNKGKA